MDPLSQARFDTLRKADPVTWTEADREFMTARRGYLHADEVQTLALEPAPTNGYADLPLAQLKETAIARDIEFDEKIKKAQLIELLEAADAAAQ